MYQLTTGFDNSKNPVIFAWYLHYLQSWGIGKKAPVWKRDKFDTALYDITTFGRVCINVSAVGLLLVFRQYLKTYHHPYNQCEKSTSCGFNNLLIMFVKSWIRLLPALVFKYFSALLIISLLIFTITSLFLSSRKYNNNASMCDCFRYQKGRGIHLLMISALLFITPSLFLW